METTARTEVAYDGEALREGIMDVRDLAPALLAIGSLCERANYLLNGDRAAVSVRVRTEDKGSFKFWIDLWQSLPDPVREILTIHKASEATDILRLLGLVGGSVGGSVLAVFKFLKNRKPTKETPLANGLTRIEVSNTYIDVHTGVALLAKDSKIKSEWGNALAPLRHPGIDTFELRKGDEKIQLAEKSELDYFKLEDDPPTSEKKIFHDSKNDVPLIIVKPALRDGLKWEVARDSESSSFSAEMKDEGFLARVRSHDELFGVGDILLVKLRTQSYFTPQGTVRTEYEILEVKERIAPPVQRSLFSD